MISKFAGFEVLDYINATCGMYATSNGFMGIQPVNKRFDDMLWSLEVTDFPLSAYVSIYRLSNCIHELT